MRTRNQAAITVAALAGIIITIVITTRPDATPPRSHHAATTACNARPADDTLPTAPPGDLTWRNLGPVLVPVSATNGPTRYRGELWTCYRHDPMGAVLAAYGIVAAAVTPDWLQIAENQFAPGAGVQAYITASGQQPSPSVQPSQVAQPVGFQVVAYTSQQATIETLADAGDGQYQADQRTLTWQDGDWKLVLTPAGAIGPDPQLVSSADGFVLWAGGGNG
jgi:hypothetical protein